MLGRQQRYEKVAQTKTPIMVFEGMVGAKSKQLDLGAHHF